MDNKQAILELQAYQQQVKSYTQFYKTMTKAILSLEAWDKVIEELEKEMNKYENVLSDLSYSDGLGYALATIEEHLKEIEE